MALHVCVCAVPCVWVSWFAFWANNKNELFNFDALRADMLLSANKSVLKLYYYILSLPLLWLWSSSTVSSAQNIQTCYLYTWILFSTEKKCWHFVEYHKFLDSRIQFWMLQTHEPIKQFIFNDETHLHTELEIGRNPVHDMQIKWTDNKIIIIRFALEKICQMCIETQICHL